jgi:HSP20 family protein
MVMAILRWRPGTFGWHRDPFVEVEAIQREMGRLMDSLSSAWRGVTPAGVFPALNVSEDGDNLYVRAELPGVHAKDLEISVQDENLVIKGERKIGTEREKASYHRREREAGTFQRIISLPTRVDAGKVTAVCKNGVLTVTLPKAAEVKPRQIAVKVG